MALITSRTSWFLTSFIFFFIQLPCLAQDSASRHVVPVTASARQPDSSSITSNQPSPTRSAPAQTHTIQVGLADHKFRPDVVEAEIGDIVEFRFYPTNHSVVRADYGLPCIPYEMTGTNKQGFFSSFHATDKVVDDPSKYSLQINDTAPIFFYCSAPGSCITYGMVGAINPNSSTPISTQQQLARNSAYMLNPGEPFPAESPVPSNPPRSTTVPTAGTQKHSLGPGTIVGIVVAALSVLILGALLFFFWGRTKTLKEEVERRESSITRHVSRSSSTAKILQTSPATGFRSEPGILQHYTSPTLPHPQSEFPQPYSTPASTHLSPRLGLDEKHPSSPPQGHPALAGYPPFSTYPDTSSTPQPQNQTFELSPTSYSHLRAHSPRCNSTFGTQTSPYRPSDRKLGPYGHQALNAGAGSAPPYGRHVNSSLGPVEIEGTPVDGRRPRARWEEVGVEEEGRMF